MAITPRGWWTSVCGLVSVAYGVAIELPVLSLVGLITLGMVFGTWLVLGRLLRYSLNDLKMDAIFSEPGPLRIGRALSLNVSIQGLHHPLSSLIKVEPVALGRFQESSLAPIVWKPIPSGCWSGKFGPVPSQIGRAGILGFGFCIQDPAGWFKFRGFYPARCEKPVLGPGHVPRVTPKTARKKTNVLTRPGLFLHEKPGQSMEFLGLRDFQPGDLSRRVSWKASLRRDRLLLRETEWEVPAVVQCLVDAGNYNRREVTKSQTSPLDEMAVLVGQLFRRVMDHGNPSGLSLVSESGIVLVPPGLGPGHLLRTELAFADIASHAAPPHPRQAPLVAAWADGVLGNLYPDLMDPSTNRVPFWNAWIEGFPAYPSHTPGQSPTLAERLDRGRFWFWLAGPLGWALLPVIFALTERNRRIGYARKRVSAALSSLLCLAPGALERMLQDDEFFVDITVKGLARNGIKLPPLGPQEIMVAPGIQLVQGDRLAKTLLGRLANARDHQVFVVILCASRIVFGLSPLIEALRRCAVRGHRVIVWDIVFSDNVEGGEGLLQRRVANDLTLALGSSGADYWSGTVNELLAKWDILFRKEGLLGTKRKK